MITLAINEMVGTNQFQMVYHQIDSVEEDIIKLPEGLKLYGNNIPQEIKVRIERELNLLQAWI